MDTVQPSHQRSERETAVSANHLPPVSSLQQRLVRRFLLVGAVLVVLMAGATLLLTGRMISAVEEKESKRAWDRVAALEREKSNAMRTMVEDHAYSDAMAEFVESPTPTFAERTFDAWTLGNADFDGVMVITADDRPLLAAVAPGTAMSTDETRAARSMVSTDASLRPMPRDLEALVLAMPEREVVRTGGDTGIAWRRWQDHWVQIAIGAIGRKGEPPNGGLLVFLRVFDEARRADRAVASQVEYRIAAFDADVPAIAAIPGAAALAVPLEDPILGTTAMAVGRHLHETSALLRKVQWATVAGQVLLLAALMGVLIALLKRQVLDRVATLRSEVEGMRLGAIRRLDLPGARDELALLGEEFSAVHRALEGARTQWREAALRDPLTQLGNRAALQARLDVMLTTGRGWPAALHLLDLDGFKAINDVHGHQTGDALLVALAASLTAKLGDDAEVFRLGGDEYAILANHQRDIGGLVLDAVADVRVLDLSGHALRLSASLGRAALASAISSPGDWLRRADIAMYEAKRAGGNRMVEFVEAMHESLLERESIERRLRRALDEGAIDVAFQPIVAARDGRLVAVEALARWVDVERGRVPPSRFVPVDEEAGLRAGLDLEGLGKALPTLLAVREACPDAVLQFNLAPPSLLTPGIVDRIEALLGAAGMGTDAVLVEVTESAIAAEPQAVGRVMARLRAAGLRIALDDFGTGYSSFARLADLKPAALKIDGAFVRDYAGDGGRIIRSILGLAKAFGLHATAEFVETEAQGAYLREVGCDALQGYGIAEPMARDRLLDWVADQAATRSDGGVDAASTSTFASWPVSTAQT